MSKYTATIGIEIHVELKTNSKVFSPSKNDYNSTANTNICEIDLGYPGVLPTLNKGVIMSALKACLGLNCNIKVFKFFLVFCFCNYLYMFYKFLNRFYNK